MICGLIVRKMKGQGYTQLCGFDGAVRDGYFSEFPQPPQVGRHRPDCISYNPLTKKYAIGEAKTSADLSSDRTREELIDFSDYCLANDNYDKVIFGFPSSSEKLVIKIMDKMKKENRGRIELFVYFEEIDDDF